VQSKEKPLTPRGMTVLKDIFEKCDTLLFRIHVSKNTTDHTATICKKSLPQREYLVFIPKEGQIHGSQFGTCSCGCPKKEGVPCDHMVAIVKVGAIATLTRVAIIMASSIPRGSNLCNTHHTNVNKDKLKPN
jgi:hypothetical protein